MLGRLKWLADRLIEPLRVDDDLENFRLSIPEVQTTTVEGDIGWNKRPPATLQCPRCENDIYQAGGMDPIDCPRCVAEFTRQEFPELELLTLHCPICKDRMRHGRRHPKAFDIPEWATCRSCHYHWEFDHF